MLIVVLINSPSPLRPCQLIYILYWHESGKHVPVRKEWLLKCKVTQTKYITTRWSDLLLHQFRALCSFNVSSVMDKDKVLGTDLISCVSVPRYVCLLSEGMFKQTDLLLAFWPSAHFVCCEEICPSCSVTPLLAYLVFRLHGSTVAHFQTGQTLSG